MSEGIFLQSGLLKMAVTPSGIRITETERGQTLLDTKGGWPLLSVLAGQRVDMVFKEIQESPDGAVLKLAPSSEGAAISEYTLRLRALPDALELSGEFTAARDTSLNALEVFPPETRLNVYDVVNFRNRHFTPEVWPELLAGGEMQTSTYSNDWQFAPHPTALLLRKDDLTTFVGFADLLAGFGFRMEAKRFKIEHWEVDFGAEPHGLKLAKGEVFQTGRLRIFSRKDASPYEIYAEFGGMLVRDGSIADPAKKSRAAWWQEPLYCTWGDQWMLGEKSVAASLAEQTAESAVPAAQALTEDLIWKAVEIIQREKYPIRTILLDEGWAVARGDWRPAPDRLANLRAIVDRLHQLGFKVMIWWNWAEVATEAQIDPQELAQNGWLNKHGCRWRDYSDPAVQENYLKQLFRTFFSAEEGCLDLDGVKTDFLADKVHPETPVFDPSWRGEERYFQKITELFYREMRRHKADACHLGCAGNYWLAEFIDLNRTYDVHSSNWLEHENRGRMLACTSPGVPVSYDMMTCTENTDRWFESARRMGASVEIGNLLNVRDDCLSSPRPADAAYYALLKEGFEGR